VYALNPKNVVRFRESAVGGSAMGDKSDRIDRKVIATYLAAFHPQLRPLSAYGGTLRRSSGCASPARIASAWSKSPPAADEAQRTAGDFESVLPGVSRVFRPSGKRHRLGFPAVRLRRTTQNSAFGPPKAEALKPGKLKGWLKRNQYGSAEGGSRLEEMQAALTAPVLPVAEHLQSAKAARVRYLAASLLALNAEIAEREKQLTTLFESLPEAERYQSLPGAGPTLAPSLLACLGRDPESAEGGWDKLEP
jgi:hypothetical protein